MIRFLRRGKIQPSLNIVTHLRLSSYESCLTQIQAITKAKRVDTKAAKIANLLWTAVSDAAVQLKLQKAESNAAAQLKLQKAELDAAAQLKLQKVESDAAAQLKLQKAESDAAAQLKLQKAELDAAAQLKLQKLDSDFQMKLSASTAKFRSDLSSLSTRTVVEALFRKIAMMTFENQGDLRTILEASSLPSYVKKNASTGLSATMTAVNSALENDEYRQRAWELLAIPTDIPLPQISGEILYGDVSAILHKPNFRNVYLSDAWSDKSVLFFELIIKALKIDVQVVIYPEDMAALGRQMDPT